jgi:hypothetical protein
MAAESMSLRDAITWLFLTLLSGGIFVIYVPKNGAGVVAGLVMTIIGLVGFLVCMWPHFKDNRLTARPILTIGSLAALVWLLPLAAPEFIMQLHQRLDGWAGYLVIGITATILSCGAWWLYGVFLTPAIVATEKPAEPKEPASVSRTQTPSLVFVFGVPLGDNDSAEWLMVLKHYGPSLAHNCEIIFYDNDRKNIEHEWLVKNPKVPYPPPLAGESQKRIYFPEAGPEGSYGSFRWSPINPNSQHYGVSINCRDGYFSEKWEVARINGILRSSITIEHGPQWVEKNPGIESVVFRYQDPEFVPTSLATEMPKVRYGKVVHPGWKPSHRFEVPVAIIDPNGNIQVISGVKAPDGSTITDFGSWNILTKHFGDNPPDKKGN